MAEGKKLLPAQYDLDEKWDACLDLALRRVVYSTAAGAFSGLLLLRSPVTRWAAVAFGAGVGVGSAYNECSFIFERSSVNESLSPSPVRENSNAD
ncbi:MICOS complex subunit MIC10-like [Wolffia australiana]